MPLGFIKPDDSWPTWAHVLYWTVVGLVVLFIAIKTIMKSCHRVPQMHWGIRERLSQPIRKNRLREGEGCEICDRRSASGCPRCEKGSYCIECEYCPEHDQLDLRLPGFKVQIPFTHGYQDSDRRAQPFSLTAFPYTKEEGGPVVILDGYGHYTVGDDSRAVYAANYAAADLAKSAVQAVTTALRHAVDACPTTATTDEISQKTLELFDSSSAYNVKLVDFTAQPIVPTDAQLLANAMAGSPGSTGSKKRALVAFLRRLGIAG